MSVCSEGEGMGSTFTMDIPLWDSSITMQYPEISKFESRMKKQFVVAPLRSSVKETANDSKKEEVCDALRNPCSVYPNAKLSIKELKWDSSTLVERPYTSSLRILVVDDVSLNRKMLIRSISSSFRHIAEACNGSEAVQYVIDSKHKPDIILIDFHMPKMDGPTATRELRALGYKGMIIGVTGSALPADMEIFLSAGATSVLTKPYHVEDLYAAIAGNVL